MQRKVFNMTSIKYYFPGISLIAIAVIIVAFPEVLIAIIAATIIFAGVIALCIGHKLKTGFGELEHMNSSVFDRILIDQPIIRRWYNRF